jgi:O-antigen/teichoic acid export membrane protein
MTWCRRAEIDRAVAFALFSRGGQALAGPVTLLLIAHYFKPEEQGLYYTFTSLVALQLLVDLGLSAVITNVASHEWAWLKLNTDGRIVGEPNMLSRLVSLGRWIFKWYAVASVFFCIGVGTAGLIFFGQAQHVGIQWQPPWITLVTLTALSLWTLPFIALLEGCNQVATIQRFRFTQVVLSNIAIWVTLVLGGGLWMSAVSAGIGVLCNLYLLFIQFRHFFEPFFKLPITSTMCWRTEVWPMQWRLALTGVSGYCMFSLLNPVMFQYHGATVAGQMGMTWTIVNNLQALAFVWLSTKVPRFGMLIAKKDYAELDRFWFRTLCISLVVMILGASVVWLLIYSLNAWHIALAGRLLAPFPTGLLLLASAFMMISLSQTIYLRAHKQEPLLVISITSGILNGLLVWFLGSHFGPTGAASAYLITAVTVVIWETNIWFRCRAKWHSGLSSRLLRITQCKSAQIGDGKPTARLRSF